MAIAMPNTLKNKNTVGLLGNYNDNDKDDFIPRGANTSLSSPSERQVFENFGSKCNNTFYRFTCRIYVHI
ncbi:hypothetical protein DPMN_076419 [Dreissena polymorpha]|uniref:Uncharacterized protein n=1 Tax=Dreissena polymorpha TaxID=45954 RepID=A0A9D4BNM1_DREPO|nr:hypothetical protein DPMN_076419 [Dreissena polymorpha]